MIAGGNHTLINEARRGNLLVPSTEMHSITEHGTGRFPRAYGPRKDTLLRFYIGRYGVVLVILAGDRKGRPYDWIY